MRYSDIRFYIKGWAVDEQASLFEGEPDLSDRAEFIDGIMAAWDKVHPEEALVLEWERLRRLEEVKSER